MKFVILITALVTLLPVYETYFLITYQWALSKPRIRTGDDHIPLPPFGWGAIALMWGMTAVAWMGAMSLAFR